ncbi:hypothetical protein D3C78_1853550 [compost metagenome]
MVAAITETPALNTLAHTGRTVLFNSRAKINTHISEPRLYQEMVFSASASAIPANAIAYFGIQTTIT